MQKQNPLTLTGLHQLFHALFEEYRTDGLAMRRELIHAEMRDLRSPYSGTGNGEYGTEVGCLFTAQFRFTLPRPGFLLALCTPEDMNPVWVLMIIDATGNPAAVVLTELTFKPEVISQMVSLTALLDEQSYSPQNIIAIPTQRRG